MARHKFNPAIEAAVKVIEVIEEGKPATVDVLGLTAEEFQTIRNALFWHKKSTARWAEGYGLSPAETEGEIATRLYRDGGLFDYAVMTTLRS